MPGLPHQRSADAAAFEVLFRATAPLVRGYATRHVGTELADDVVGETFTVVWRRWADLPDLDDERRAWVFGVARRSMLALSRRQRGLPMVGGDHLTANLADVAGDHADLVAGRDRVSRLLAELPPRERDAMELAVWFGLTPAQAAKVLGCSRTALTTRLTRARRRLDAILGEESITERGVDRAR